MKRKLFMILTLIVIAIPQTVLADNIVFSSCECYPTTWHVDHSNANWNA